ncbi:nitrate/nitrite transporter NrtS [Alteromonas sp. a30]|uniref:nitrate/nitrite transporter NrtS n=1 Tax=Alteromonas sp. a30 TaxID=2730917 RepID=UPI00227FAC36|nr:nitrate/nitrite transporter NrtS [Alteromonas sp. a30]MCY7297147.1 nitrate/nitrite transporter NrtS [Alteromonas sp. a30]
MSQLTEFFIQPQVVKRAFIVAIIVGTILNIINQGENFLNQSVVWWKVILTYMVPYCVSTYSSAAERSKKCH